VGASAPPAVLAPWFIVAILLVQWDPTRITGEWAECLAGALFVAVTWRRGAPWWPAPAAALVFAAALTVGGSRRSGGDHLACANAEAAALAADLATGAATERLLTRGAPFKRVWAAAGAGEVDLSRAGRFMSVRCEGTPAGGAAERRQYAVDPWGNSYNVAVERTPDGVEVHVHSSGPNRRRDSHARIGGGDDVTSTAVTSAGSSIDD
jgi:hypothetical protein